MSFSLYFCIWFICLFDSVCAQVSGATECCTPAIIENVANDDGVHA